VHLLKLQVKGLGQTTQASLKTFEFSSVG